MTHHAMSSLETEALLVDCPYCGEMIDILIDLSIETQEYTEDCSVCCRPMVVTINTSQVESSVSVRSENE